MKIYRIQFLIAGLEDYEWLSYAVNSKQEALDKLKEEMLKKYNPETVQELVIIKIERW